MPPVCPAVGGVRRRAELLGKRGRQRVVEGAAESLHLLERGAGEGVVETDDGQLGLLEMRPRFLPERESPMANHDAEELVRGFAADTLIPPEPYRNFAAGGRPTKSDVVRFSDQIGIAPGIVVGRLQNDGVIPRNWGNDLKLRLEWA